MNEPFEIYTDASRDAIGAVVQQKDRVIAIYSAKLNDTEKRYSVVEKEMFVILITLQFIKYLLTGVQITIYTDVKNNTFEGKMFQAEFNVDRIFYRNMIMKLFSLKVTKILQQIICHEI